MDVNNPTGSTGLVAVDKRGRNALFLDPESYQEISRLPLPARPHEIAVSADHTRAFVSVYGNGVYGNNTKPGTQIIVLDLETRAQIGEIGVAPYFAPHGLTLSADG